MARGRESQMVGRFNRWLPAMGAVKIVLGMGYYTIPIFNRG